MTLKRALLAQSPALREAGRALATVLIVLGTGGMADATPTFTTVDFPGAKSTYISAINGTGLIAGNYSDHIGTHGFLRASDGTFTPFDLPGSIDTEPVDINGTGWILGWAHDSHGNLINFLRAPDGTFTTFAVPGTEATNPQCVNSTETVSGSYSDASGNHGFVRTADGTITTFDITKGMASSACINGKGVIAGSYHRVLKPKQTGAYMRSAGGKVTKFTVYRRTQATALGVTSSGVIFGNYQTHNGPLFGYERGPDGEVSPVYIPNSQSTWISCMSGGGAIAGGYLDSAGHAHLFDTFGNYETFDVPGAIAEVPTGVNNYSVVVGNYTDSEQANHGFIRTP